MIKKSLSFIFLFSLFAIILPSVTFAMEEYQPPDMEYAKPDITDFQAEILRNRRTISIGLALVALKLTEPVVKKVDDLTLTIVHDMLVNTATVDTCFLLLNKLIRPEVKIGWGYTAAFSIIYLVSKLIQAKEIEKMTGLSKLNGIYPWLPNVLRGLVSAGIFKL